MPLGETLTLIATLASALQAFRLNRATESTVEVEQTLDPALLLALDAVKVANDDTVRRYDAAANGAHLLIGLSAATVLVSAFLGAIRDESADAGSPLFIAALVIFIVVAAIAVLLRRFCALHAFPFDTISLAGGTQVVLEEVLKSRREVQRQNQRRFAILQAGSDVLLLTVAVQVVLAALWLID